ncbi:hypothetical protein [Taklimakanibacter deserti]|uniref:hypothetical protein n=1 Tax=Taklimakanibacter deserti TaxID=2267839 RepID=UPI000E65D09B
MRWPGVPLLLLISACAHHPELLDKPDRVWASSRSMDSIASCIIRALDERGRSGSNLSPSQTHARHVIEPGKLYEIRPEQQGLATGESYTVRLEKTGEMITRISLFVQSPWKKSVIRALKPCGS